MLVEEAYPLAAIQAKRAMSVVMRGLDPRIHPKKYLRR